MANCVTLINDMKLTKGLRLFALTPVIFAQTSQSVAPGSVRPDGAYQVGNGVSPPSVMFKTTCEIPDLARKVRAQGEVTLSLVVKSDGSVRDVEVVKPAGYGMDQRDRMRSQVALQARCEGWISCRCCISICVQFRAAASTQDMGRGSTHLCSG